MSETLNHRAFQRLESILASAESLRIEEHCIGGARVLDFGLHAEGGLAAGLELATICLSNLATVSLVASQIGQTGWPHLQIQTDCPVTACLLSQYAGWQISVGDFFAMGSGPMRALAAREELFKKLDYRETADECVGVLEASRLPTASVLEALSEKTGLEADRTALLIAPTSSQAGTVQIAARSVETALHKLWELGFDVNRIVSGYGTAPLAPVAGDDLTGIGRTNDAILYGGRVMLWVRGDDHSLQEIGPRVPAMASQAYGQPFLEIFEEAGRDFYQIDPHLFSPAEVTFQNLETGRIHHFGNTAADVLKRSFALESS